jgi:hypothetical protein
MPSSDAPRLYGALQALHRRALADHRLAAELQRARREFFGVEANVAVRPAAELRFVEWALLERESLALAAVPMTVISLPRRLFAAGVFAVNLLSNFLIFPFSICTDFSFFRQDSNNLRG